MERRPDCAGGGGGRRPKPLRRRQCCGPACVRTVQPDGTTVGRHAAARRGMGHGRIPDAAQRQASRRFRVSWVVSEVPETQDIAPRGISVVTSGVQKIRRFLFAPDETARVLGALPEPPYGEFGYLRIYTFDVENSDELVDKTDQGHQEASARGLIIDVRENPGGRSRAAEQLLQVIAPERPIEPERLYFASTPLTLQLCRLQKDNQDLGPNGARPGSSPSSVRCRPARRIRRVFPYRSRRLQRQGPAALSRPGHRDHGRLTRSAGEVFAAGFQDHGGMILGVHADHERRRLECQEAYAVRRVFQEGAEISVQEVAERCRLPAVVPALRAGWTRGRQRDRRLRRQERLQPRTTRADLLNNNADLIRRAVAILKGNDGGSRSSGRDKKSQRGRAKRRRAASDSAPQSSPAMFMAGVPAKLLGALLQRRRVGARAGEQADRPSELAQHLRAAPGADCVGGRKHHLGAGAPPLQALEEDRDIGAEQVAAAFHQQSVGGD